MASHDIDLKLGLDAATMAALKRHPLVKELRHGPAKTQRLSTVYWDTPDLALARGGIVVRVRASGPTRVQTVKTAGIRGAGRLARQEWDWPLTGEAPDAARLASTGLTLLREDGVLARLAPAFSTELQRCLYRLGDAEWEVELALDSGEVGAGTAREPVCEAEIRLIRGQPVHLFNFARRLADAVPARILALAKSERGSRLASGTPPVPVKSAPVVIAADQSVATAFQAIARNCLDHLLANERCLLATGDPEAIHQMRVALRRLRSAMRVFRPAIAGPQMTEIRDHLGWLLGHLGPARDDDVFLAEIVEPVAAAHPETAPLAALRSDWRARRERNLAAALAAVADRRFTTLALDVAAWIEAGDWLQASDRTLLADATGPFAQRVLAKHDKRLDRAGGASLAGLTAAELHQARIRGKQLRYAGEFFAPLWRKKATRPFLMALAELQDVLGQLNDIAVAATRLTAPQDDAPFNDGGRAWAAGLVAGWHAALRPCLVAKAQKAWKRYRKSERFWRKGG